MLERSKTYIFVDVEAAIIRGKQQIIEIGAVKLLPNGTKETFSHLIKPYKFKKLNQYIQQLTGITTEEVLGAPSFIEVIAKFRKWCGEGAVFVAFGEFDRKVLEEEFSSYHLDCEFLYPIVDFQQKYMIEFQQKNQPSLASLLKEFNIPVETQHRALADAMSLLNIFAILDGEKIIEKQKTNEFVLLLSEFRQREKDYELYVSVVDGKVSTSNVSIESIKTLKKYLPFHLKEVEQVTDDGEVQIIQTKEIEPNKDVESFLQKVTEFVPNKVLITRSGLRQLSRIHRIHHCVIPKTEVMTLQHLLHNEESVNLFTMSDQSIRAYEAKLQKLIQTYKNEIIAEFQKRNLFVKEEISV